jgi:crossover junction endodeoxyribonuclease RuvC
MTTIIGIDPGQSGGLATLTPNDGAWKAAAWPIDMTERDVSDLFWQIYADSSQDVFAFVERVHSFPGQGVSSTFKFGTNYGFLRGCLHTIGIPFEEVTPQCWQKFMRCLTGGDKNVSKAKAQQLFPDLKITHAIADALLIAEYGRRVRHGGLPEPFTALVGVSAFVSSPENSQST